MRVYVCNIGGCSHAEASSKALKAHAAQVHGYPKCVTCNKTIRNLKLYGDHVASPHQHENCGLCLEKIVQGCLRAHLADTHGFPACPKCSATFERHDHFVRHVNGCTLTPCPFEDCGVSVTPTTLSDHLADTHGFPACPKCSATFERHDHFVRHVNGCTLTPCPHPGCEVHVHQTQMLHHMTTDHGFPTCPKCLDNLERYDLFAQHVAQCPDTETRHCPYPDCHELVFTNRAAWSKRHFEDAHDGFTCTHCNHDFDHVATSVHAFMLHVDKCHEKFQCSYCLLTFKTEAQQLAHDCSTDQRIHVRNLLHASLMGGTDLVLDTGKSTRAITVRFRERTPQHLPQLTEHQKSRMKYHTDPSTVELMTGNNLPVTAQFLPRENLLEDNMKLLYELETNQPPSAFWMLLVLRLCDLGEHRYAHDVLHLERILQSIQLPPGLDEACRSLHVIRNRVNLMKQRASHHTNVKLLVKTRTGDLVPLNVLLKRLGRAVGALEQEQELIDQQPEDQPICPNPDPQVRELMTQYYIKKGYPLPKKRKRLEDTGGLVEATLPSYLMPVNSTLVNSRPLNWSLADVKVTNTFATGLDCLDEEWQAMLFRFYTDILTPIVQKQSFARLRTWDMVATNLFCYNSLPPSKHQLAPPCRLPEQAAKLHKQLVKQDD